MSSTFEIFGFAGVAISTFCYAHLQLHKEFVHTVTYPLLNLLSAFLFGLSFIQEWNAASFVMNLVWGGISLFGVFNWTRAHLSDFFTEISPAKDLSASRFASDPATNS